MKKAKKVFNAIKSISSAVADIAEIVKNAISSFED